MLPCSTTSTQPHVCPAPSSRLWRQPSCRGAVRKREEEEVRAAYGPPPPAPSQGPVGTNLSSGAQHLAPSTWHPPSQRERPRWPSEQLCAAPREAHGCRSPIAARYSVGGEPINPSRAVPVPLVRLPAPSWRWWQMPEPRTCLKARYARWRAQLCGYRHCRPKGTVSSGGSPLWVGRGASATTWASATTQGSATTVLALSGAWGSRRCWRQHLDEARDIWADTALLPPLALPGLGARCSW